MKIKNGYILRKVGDVNIVVALGEESANFSAMITLNDTGAFLWRELEKGSDEAGLLAAIMRDFEDVDPEEAKKDIAEFIGKVKDAGLFEQ